MSIATQIGLLVLGLALIFFGLPLFKSAINVFGFLIGAGYAVFFYYLFASSLGLNPAWGLVVTVILALVGGILGALLANFAQALFVFVAGGFVGLMIAKFIMGAPVTTFTPEHLRGLLQFQTLDIVWFIIGGILFVLAIDTVLIFALCALGAAFLYRALDPLNLLNPEWLIPLALGIIGFIVQEAARNRAAKERKVVIVADSEHHHKH
jgi:hypothetical protein